MRLKTLLLLSLLMIPAASRLSAESAVSTDLPTRARGAARVVVATVERVRAERHRNEFGDELIVSRAEVRVKDVLKGNGAAGDALVVDVEGGTVNGITLRVSDMPTMSTGEEAVFFIEQNRDGRNVPHRRGQGILKLDANGRIRGSDLTVDDVRKAVASSRQAR